MEFTVRADRGTAVVQAEGRFTFKAHPRFRAVVDGLVGIKHITFDFSKTTYMDSSALGMLLLAKDKLPGAEIVLQNAQNDVSKVLEIACFHKLFCIK